MMDAIVARLRAWSIDDKLLTSGESERSAPVLLRRTRLLHRRYRARVAASLRGLVEAARRNERTRFTAPLHITAQEVLESEPLILTLADELEQEERVSARGVILADRLIRAGDSPVYGPDPIRHPPVETVETAVKHARAALYLG
jgi:hypothetical protein